MKKMVLIEAKDFIKVTFLKDCCMLNTGKFFFKNYLRKEVNFEMNLLYK